MKLFSKETALLVKLKLSCAKQDLIALAHGSNLKLYFFSWTTTGV